MSLRWYANTDTSSRSRADNFFQAGYSGNSALLASSIQYIINVVMTVPALLFMDRWGRRPTLLIGAALMCTFMFANGGIMGNYGTIVPGGIDGVRSPFGLTVVLHG